MTRAIVHPYRDREPFCIGSLPTPLSPLSEEKLQRFKSTENRPTVVCLCCGSADIIQDSFSFWKCTSCGNSMNVDGLSFAVVGNVEEAKIAFQHRDMVPPWVDAKDVVLELNDDLETKASK